MMSESQTIDEDAAMQRLLTEAYAEFEFEEPAKVPGSEYVKRCPKETDKQSRGVSTAEGIPHKSSQGVSTAEANHINMHNHGTQADQINMHGNEANPYQYAQSRQ